MATAAEIIQLCVANLVGPNLHNCSGFLRDMAIAVGVNEQDMLGTDAMPVMANQQVTRLIQSPLWTNLGQGDDGAKAAAKTADGGSFVVAGWNNSSGNGHVAVVVTGPLENGWPRGFWGHLGGAPGSNLGLRHSFGPTSRPDVVFFSR